MQVNVAARSSAISPRAIDDLMTFEGNYNVRYVNGANGHNAPSSLELAIVKRAGASLRKLAWGLALGPSRVWVSGCLLYSFSV